VAKSRKHRSKGKPLAREDAEKLAPPTVPWRRRWLYRLAAATIVPLLALVILELVLRIGGYGYPASFFLKIRIQGRTVFVENDKFGRRFFPPALVRSPAPLVMPADKPTNTYRIFLMGESAALGDPEPAYGFGRYLEVLLRERFPGTRFEVICAGMTAINSHAILPIARECARHQGDLWILYMGNNEMEGPFGAGTVFGARAPRLGLIRTSLALKTTKVGQALDTFLDWLGTRASVPDSWQGLKMFLDHQVHLDDPGRQQVYKNFKQNLEDILRARKKAGVQIIVSTVASNLKDCAPFASLHAAALNGSQQSAFQQRYREGQALETAGEFSEALDRYSLAASLDREFAELQFHLGRCHLALTNYDQARRCFELARDWDTLPFRADSRLNEIIQYSCRENAAQGVRELDAMKALSPRGIPGQEAFYEHVHPNFQGNYLLARALAEQVAGLLPEAIARRSSAEWAPAERCDQRLALTDWNRYQVYETILARLSDAPFTNQLDHLPRLKMYSEKLAELASRMTPQALARAQDTYRAALAAAPEDGLLREKFAEFLERTGRLSEATAQWQRACESLPHHFLPYFRLGKLFDRQGKFGEAEAPLSRAAAMRPDFVEGLNELGRCLFKQGKLAESLARHRKALRQQPANPQTHYYLADALAAQGRRDEALKSLREAIRLQPGFWEARYLLGVELALRGEIQEAKEQFAEVVRLRPDYALAHLNLGVALANQGKLDDALAEFEVTLRLDPENKSAQQRMQGLQLFKRRQP